MLLIDYSGVDREISMLEFNDGEGEIVGVLRELARQQVNKLG